MPFLQFLMDFLQPRMGFLRARVDFLQSRVRFLQARMDFLQTRMEFLQARMESLQTRMQFLQTRMDFLQTRMEFLRSRMDSLPPRMEFLHSGVNIRQASAEFRLTAADFLQSPLNSWHPQFRNFEDVLDQIQDSGAVSTRYSRRKGETINENILSDSINHRADCFGSLSSNETWLGQQDCERIGAHQQFQARSACG